MLTTTAVYNVRAYQDQTVIITPGSEVGSTTTNEGKTEYKLALAKEAHFMAEARFPMNSGVIWSTDPSDEGHGRIEAYTGKYTAPMEMPSDQEVAIVATSLGDKNKVNRLAIHFVKADATNNANTPTGPAKVPFTAATKSSDQDKKK